MSSQLVRFAVSVCIAACLWIASPLSAQFTTSVEGTVADQTGAAVAEARLTLTSIDTGVALETLSNSTGTYRFPNVPPGKYRLRVTKTGFQTMIQENIVLETGRVQSVPISLAVGAISQEVTVAAAVTPVETTNPKISTTVTNEYVQNIPLSLRNVYNVIQLAPGVTGFGMGTADSFTTI